MTAARHVACQACAPRKRLRVWQVGLLVALFVFWHVMTTPGLLPNFMFDNDRQAAFFFGEPLKIAAAASGPGSSADADIYRHLGVTLIETLLAFGIGSVLGLGARAVAGAAARWPAASSSPTSRR